MERLFQLPLADSMLSVTIGKVAEQANGECIVRYGDTVVLVTTTCSKEPREGIDFFPLSVDYEEKLYAVGKIPGGFIKREGRPSEKAILTSRLIDRPIRPLFPEGFRNDVQVLATVLSVDQDHSPEIAAMIGSSIALTVSDIPFNGPTGSVNIGFINGQYIINPNEEQRNISDISLTVSGTKDAIMMVEAGSNEVSEAQMLEAILVAHEEIKRICAFISTIKSEVGKDKMPVNRYEYSIDLFNEISNSSSEAIATSFIHENKQEREAMLQSTISDIKNKFIEKYGEEISKDVSMILDDIVKREVRKLILIEKKRPDGRGLDEIRQLTAETGLLPRTHGSGLFKRGQTQVLSVATLGALSEVQVIDGLGDDIPKRYIHHYNFPPYSVGDARPMRSPGRREIGHGALAERALLPVIPTEEKFPYTIRVVSEVLSSNGSSSQASVCGSTLALMDAGVPIKAPVAGIAMGLVKEDDYVTILTDIQGLEDHLGDMDFKVAGTREGITAVQMDIKIGGIDKNILKEALEKARIARLQILDLIDNTIPVPRDEMSPYAPRVFMMHIDPDKIREVIGTGGKVINKIIDDTGVKIDIEDDGKILITAPDQKSGMSAVDIIEDIVKEVEVGDIYKGKVTRIMAFGAFVDIHNGKEGLVHISQLARERVAKVEDVVNIGDEIEVKVIEIDNQGRINLSHKVLLPKEEQ